MSLLADARLAMRTLTRAKGFTTVAVGTLAAGLALCVCVTAAVDAYLLRALPYPESDRLFDVRYAAPGAMAPRGLEKLDWASLGDVVEYPIAWDLDQFTLRGAPHPQAASGAWVTSGFAQGLGVRAAIGRAFEPADFEAGRPSVALIGHRLWQTRFGGDSAIVGRQFEAFVNDRPSEVERFTIIGVLPEGMWHLNAFTEIFAPLKAPTFPYMVRLRAGVPVAAAADRISALVRGGASSVPENWRAELRSTQASYVAQVQPLLLSTAVATGLVLLIACANVVVLLLVRVSHRRRELAVRRALGASTLQIARVLVAESLLIGGWAMAIGLALGYTILLALAPAIERQLGRRVPGGTDALASSDLALLAGLAGGLLVTCACVVVPLIASRRTPVAQVLTAGQKGATDGPAQARARSVLITIEVAACLTLLVGAVLVVDSGLRMLRVDMGLTADDVLVGRVNLRARSYPEPADRLQFYERSLARLSAVPGVRSVAFTNAWPLQEAPPVLVRSEAAGAAVRAGLVSVTPAYFETVGIRLRDGRSFTAGDRFDTEPVAVVSDSLARRLWPAGGGIGGTLQVSRVDAAAATPPSTFRVVGISGDVRHAHTDQELADIYLPVLQQPGRSVFAYVRFAGPTPPLDRDLGEAVAAVDAEVPFGSVRMLSAILDEQRARPRLLAALLVTFAALAGVLALVGLYGVIAYAVRRREREIAVRLAVGADRRAITRLFVRQGAPLLLTGLVLGAGGAVLLGRVLQTQLFGISGADPAVVATTSVAFGLCGLAAVWCPARRAAGIDPVNALKE